MMAAAILGIVLFSVYALVVAWRLPKPARETPATPRRQSSSDGFVPGAPVSGGGSCADGGGGGADGGSCG